MAELRKSQRLRKELTLFNVYTIATGATIASGFFLLPGLAATEAGPAMPLSYLLAALLLFPGLLSTTELSTAMPRAGGIYYFLDRSMGPLLGTIGGFGTWIALMLKSAFALVGLGAYLALFLPELPMQPVAAGFAILFGLLNLSGAKNSGSAQVVLVVGLLLLLTWFCGIGIVQIKAIHFQGFFTQERDSLLSTTGLVIVSYMGLTKVASISEEVKDPERNLPLGIFLAFGTAIVIYALGTSIMIGVMSAEKISGDLTPVASVAEVLFGHWGAVLMTIAAVLAFASVANAGILSASRYPLAMSRDHMLPERFRRINANKTPTFAILITVLFIILFVTVFNPAKIAKLASAFQLVMFALSCLAVIVMRESRIESYDPGYRSPFYPWLHISGIFFPFIFIAQMGRLPILFTLGLITIGILWYIFYARLRVKRGGAIFHIFARLGEQRFEGLDRELRGILKEKGLRDEDPFDYVIAHSMIIQLDEAMTFEQIVKKASYKLAERVGGDPDRLIEGFMQGTRIGATPVSHGAALPHLRLPQIDHPELVMVRSMHGVMVDIEDELFADLVPDEPVHAFFFLASQEENPGQHLRILAQIAGRVDDEAFMQEWLSANNEQYLKEVMLRDDRFISLRLLANSSCALFVGQMVSEIALPEGSMIVLIHRSGQMIVPRGSTLLEVNDRLTIIGDPPGISSIRDQYK